MLTRNPETQDRRCVDCHFLEKYVRGSDGKHRGSAVSKEERKQLAERGALDEPPAPWSVACNRNVWDEANPGTDSCQDIRKIINQDRGESCFFYPYEPGIFFPAAEELERRAADRREAHRDRTWVKRGFFLATAALLFNLGWNCYVHHDSKEAKKDPAVSLLDE